MADPQVIGLFPTPIMHVPDAAGPQLCARIAAKAAEGAERNNAHDDKLSHTDVVDPAEDADYRSLVAKLQPHLRAFGGLLLGEELKWLVKEAWVNRMQTGGAQAMHNHANSFISVVVYLTDTGERSRTVFHRPIGGGDYAFVNENAATRSTPFNAKKWVSPPMQAGDAILFPSFLLHEVPPNEGPERMTVALNALPERLNSWGYEVRFA